MYMRTLMHHWKNICYRIEFLRKNQSTFTTLEHWLKKQELILPNYKTRKVSQNYELRYEELQFI